MFVETCVYVCVCDVVGRQAVHHHIIFVLLFIFQIEDEGRRAETWLTRKEKKRRGKEGCTPDAEENMCAFVGGVD